MKHEHWNEHRVEGCEDTNKSEVHWSGGYCALDLKPNQHPLHQCCFVNDFARSVGLTYSLSGGEL